jgi:hypothetical protein
MGQNASVLKVLAAVYLEVVWGWGANNNESDKSIMFPQNNIPVKNTSHAEELQLCTV